MNLSKIKLDNSTRRNKTFHNHRPELKGSGLLLCPNESVFFGWRSTMSSEIFSAFSLEIGTALYYVQRIERSEVAFYSGWLSILGWRLILRGEGFSVSRITTSVRALFLISLTNVQFHSMGWDEKFLKIFPSHGTKKVIVPHPTGYSKKEVYPMGRFCPSHPTRSPGLNLSSA
jgi:hypothetical protein